MAHSWLGRIVGPYSSGVRLLNVHSSQGMQKIDLSVPCTFWRKVAASSLFVCRILFPSVGITVV